MQFSRGGWEGKGRRSEPGNQPCAGVTAPRPIGVLYCEMPRQFSRTYPFATNYLRAGGANRKCIDRHGTGHRRLQ